MACTEPGAWHCSTQQAGLIGRLRISVSKRTRGSPLKFGRNRPLGLSQTHCTLRVAVRSFCRSGRSRPQHCEPCSVLLTIACTHARQCAQQLRRESFSACFLLTRCSLCGFRFVRSPSFIRPYARYQGSSVVHRVDCSATGVLCLTRTIALVIIPTSVTRMMCCICHSVQCSRSTHTGH